MTTVTVYTAERMAEIEAQAVIGASIVGGHLIMERYNGTTFDAGAIDVSIIGDLTFAKDNEEFYIYTDAAGPLSLSANIQTPLSETIMDTNDGDPAWGHWEDADDNFVVDVAGLYSVYSYGVIDSSGSSTGRSTLHVSGSIAGDEVEFTNMSGIDARLVTQVTALYDVGDVIRVDVMSTVNALNVTYAEIYIQKFNVTLEGGAESGTGVAEPLSDGLLYHRFTSGGSTGTLVANTPKRLISDLMNIDDGDVDGYTWDDTTDPGNDEGLVVGKQCLYEMKLRVVLDSSGLTTGQAHAWIDAAGSDRILRTSTIRYGSTVDMELVAQGMMLVPATGRTTFWVQSSTAVDVIAAEIEFRRLATYP